VADVRLVDLEIIKRYSLAVRREIAPAEEVLAALDHSRAAVLEAMGQPAARAPRRTASRAASRDATPAPASKKRGTSSASRARTTRTARPAPSRTRAAAPPPEVDLEEDPIIDSGSGPVRVSSTVRVVGVVPPAEPDEPVREHERPLRSEQARRASRDEQEAHAETYARQRPLVSETRFGSTPEAPPRVSSGARIPQPAEPRPSRARLASLGRRRDDDTSERVSRGQFLRNGVRKRSDRDEDEES
jgi:hypothetical protein